MISNKNFIGEKFNNWTVIDWVQDKKEIEWICRCKCGKIKQQKVDNIKNGRSKMCKECSSKLKRKEKKVKQEKVLRRRYDSNKDWTEDNIFVGTYKEYLKECKNRRKKQEQQIQQEREEKIKELDNNNIGKKFNHLTVIEVIRNKGATKWRCKCDCGNEYIGDAKYIKYGNIKSCGCISKEIIKNSICHKKIYNVWGGMINRCYNPNSSNYKNYGGRGIIVCEEWRKSARNFIEWAYNNGYNETAQRGNCTIDRIDNNGNYEPSNCRWVDMKIQNSNKRQIGRLAKRYKVYGDNLTLKEIQNKYKISPQLFAYRKQKGMTNEEAVSLGKKAGYKYEHRK